MRSGTCKTPTTITLFGNGSFSSIKKGKWHTKVVINHDLEYLWPHWELNHRTNLTGKLFLVCQ